MEKELLPTKFQGINDEVYAGFWIRFAAKLVDVIVCLPFFGLMIYINDLSKQAYYLAIIPNLAFFVWFEVYLVKRYGGTPGKLWMGIRIIHKNGVDADWRAATLRYLVSFSMVVYGVFIMVYTLNMIDNNTYMGLSFMQRGQFLNNLAPVLSKIDNWLSFIWMIAGLIVLLSNPRKRTVHDFIGGTVVIKSIYLDRIRETADIRLSEEELR